MTTTNNRWHIPADTDTSDTLIPAPWALIVGIAVTALLGIPMLIWSVELLFSLLPKLIVFVIALSLAMTAVRFWCTKAYENGATVAELLLLVFWPVEMALRVWHRARHNENSTDMNDWFGNNALTARALPRVAALAFGVVVTVVALALLVDGLWAAMSVIWAALLLACTVWVVGVVGYFWLSKAYEDGLTENELNASLRWPVNL